MKNLPDCYVEKRQTIKTKEKKNFCANIPTMSLSPILKFEGPDIRKEAIHTPNHTEPANTKI